MKEYISLIIVINTKINLVKRSVYCLKFKENLGSEMYLGY